MIGIKFRIYWKLETRVNINTYLGPSSLSDTLKRRLGSPCLMQPAVWPTHDDVIKWKHFPRYWPFVRGIHRSR